MTRSSRIALAIVFALGAPGGAWTAPVPAEAQDNAEALPRLNRFPRMVQEYLVARIRRIEREANERRAGIGDRDAASAYVRDVRRRIAECFGPFPPRTPLSPRVTSVVERDVYRIENVIFESRPGFLVTANLYIPKGCEFPRPGIIGTCGHSSNGKAASFYQAFAQGLARQGYVVLIYDPIGQGERLQYPNAELRSRVGVGVAEHLRAGNQQVLVGEFLGSWRAWDGIRALDYLLTRSEVDPAVLGVTGNSGGGTMTTWLAGLERRWTMAAPACFVTTFRRNLENELPADTEQCPPRALALGLDHSDFLAALAPRPVIVLAKEKDYFDARGSEEAYARLRRLWGILGVEDRVALQLGPTGHGYSQENREAMYRWFNQHSETAASGDEPALAIEADNVLECAPRGQVSTLGSRTVFSFTKEKSEDLRKKRKRLSSSELADYIRRIARVPSQARDAPEYRILRHLPPRGYPKRHFATYAVETDPGIQAIVYRLTDSPHYSRPPRDGSIAMLYIAHHSSDEELRTEPLLRELVKDHPRTAFFACDVRGIGESRPNTCGMDTFLHAYGSDYFYAAHGLMLGDPYVAQRTRDVLRVLDWLGSCGHEEVHLVARGWGTIPAALAAVVSSRVTRVTLKNTLSSYSEIAESEDYSWPLSCFLPGVLEHFDLPDCYRVLREKELRVVDPWGPNP